MERLEQAIKYKRSVSSVPLLQPKAPMFLPFMAADPTGLDFLKQKKEISAGG